MSGNDSEILEILKKYPKEQRFCLAMMQDLQRQYNYIPREGMDAIAEYLSCPLSSLYSMATFYKALSLKPKGKHIIKLCDGTACHVRKSQPIYDAIRKYLCLSGKKKTSADGVFTLETVACLGACGLAPVMTVDGEVHAKMTPESAVELLEDIRRKEASEA